MDFSFLLQFWVVAIAGRINEYQHAIIAYKDEEIRCLREQLKKAIGKERPRFTDPQRVRLAVKAKQLGRATLHKINPLVTPDTLLRWHKRLIAQKYDSSRTPRVGRPPISEEIKELILQFARQNRGWGYPRIVGELAKLGHDVCSSTVANVLHARGLDPVPSKKSTDIGIVQFSAWISVSCFNSRWWRLPGGSTNISTRSSCTRMRRSAA